MPRTQESLRDRIDRTAREVFGFAELRDEQRTAVEALVTGRDTLVVMPTGSGKSAIYQIAALLIDGPTVVISPLISLQRDQVAALREGDIAEAASVNSTIRASEVRETFEELRSGELEFLFLAPEQFGDPDRLAELRDAAPSLFVVDEAHCISAWGHDFRPEYLRLGAVAEELGGPTIAALTATAAPPVRLEILERLRMRDPLQVIGGFDRPNIHLEVRLFAEEDRKTEALLERVRGAEGCGLVYVATRKKAEQLAEQLAAEGLRAAAYHAGLKARERDEVQQAFMDGGYDVVVATVAFGMGIDKPDVRYVYHHDISDSVDAYYQEIGRAGRDGEPAEAVLFYRLQDVGLRNFFAGSGKVDQEQLTTVAKAVLRHDEPVDPEEIRRETGLSKTKVTSAVGRLEGVGAVEVLADGQVEPGDDVDGPQEAGEVAVQAEHDRQDMEKSRVAMVRGYAETRDCRRQYLLNYFGEPYDTECGHCDNCEAGHSIREDEASQPFPLNARVRHGEWGEGQVVRYEGTDKLVALFDSVGYKTMSVPAVVERNLLTAL